MVGVPQQRRLLGAQRQDAVDDGCVVQVPPARAADVGAVQLLAQRPARGSGGQFRRMKDVGTGNEQLLRMHPTKHPQPSQVTETQALPS